MRHPLRVLLVFANLCAGPEEVDLRLLAERADPERLRFTVVACAEAEEAGAAGRGGGGGGGPPTRLRQRRHPEAVAGRPERWAPGSR